MTKSARLALAVAVFAPLVVASPLNPPNAPALAPKLHIKSFTIVSPACNKVPEFRAEIQNLTGTPFEGNKTMSPTAGPQLQIRLLSKPNAWNQALPAVGGGATLPIKFTWPGTSTACPSDNCWELSLFNAGPLGGAGASLPEWDGKAVRICAKTSCDPHATKSKTPCTFELYSSR